MTGALIYPLATRWSLSAAVERIDEFGEAFAEWALKQMVGIAVEIVIDLLL
jgi:hypothetical protein